MPKDKRGESPFSTDANLLHTSSEGKVLEDPWAEVPDYVYSRTDDPVAAPDTPEEITIEFKARRRRRGQRRGAVARRRCSTKLNELGKRHGIGRLDLVENRFVGMKSRGMYETPGGTIYHAAHRGDRAADARPRRRAPQGRADAALCGADLQRLLVLAGARDAAGGDRPQPGQGRRHGPDEALQGRRARHRPPVAQRASTARRS